MNGIVNILKPTGMTSHDVVGMLRKITGIKKIGHTGTLDPNAAGVLPVCIGRATRICEFIQDKKKKYRAELTLGIKTDTYDSFGAVLERISDFEMPSEDDILRTIESFRGEQLQQPPIYSALKVNGKKLYELARAGKSDVEIKSRRIFIHDIKVVRIKGNSVLFDVECSKGTYIRSICNDIGDKLGLCAYMSFLLRMSSGEFNLENSYTLEEFEEALRLDGARGILLPTDFALREYKQVEIYESAMKSFLNGAYVYGKGFAAEDDIEEGELVRVYSQGIFYGIGRGCLEEDQLCIKCYKLLV
ncbi:MAG: tRNA pseudouridine(55) synthase TruB [Peptoclostridium sp.]|uniref:tRNA pseudouridine(55) synthase TruB n=1 Tax=Peptoclostridium sp. TaxID=1904860 RepID=UPI00139D79AC|nr:tRNA pseudouridine(55) synthase TruB [Peptoclostridium sp.]MZQ75170.1 tRNA pseudouridine(55) synthase TruB [Peptoclostridium sp.]